MQNFKQNAVALQYWSDMFPLNSRNIVDPTQLIGYDSDQKVHTNNNFCYFLLVVFSLCRIIIFCSWNASVTVFMLCCFLRFLGWKWKCMRDRRKLSFSFPTPRTGVSFLVLLSRDFSRLPPMESLLACVASVSSRGSSRKLEREQKKKKNDGGGGGERRSRLPANPTILKNCVRPWTQLLIGAVRVVLIT